MRSLALLAALILPTPLGAAYGLDPAAGGWKRAPAECYYPAAGHARVIDGDTLAVEGCHGPARVRLTAIDAPERGAPGAAEATAALHALLAPQQVALCSCDPMRGPRPGPEACPQDKYRRMLATCLNARGLDVGREMVRQGFARARYGCAYAAEHREACQARRGLWAAFSGDCAPRCE